MRNKIRYKQVTRKKSQKNKKALVSMKNPENTQASTNYKESFMSQCEKTIPFTCWGEETNVLGRKIGMISWTAEPQEATQLPKEFHLLYAVTLSLAKESKKTITLHPHSWKGSAQLAEEAVEKPLEPASLGPSSSPLLARSLGTMRSQGTWRG